MKILNTEALYPGKLSRTEKIVFFSNAFTYIFIIIIYIFSKAVLNPEFNYVFRRDAVDRERQQQVLTNLLLLYLLLKK